MTFSPLSLAFAIAPHIPLRVVMRAGHVVGGGYSANSRLRSLAAERCEEAGITLRLPPLRFCTDNGAQIAALGSAAVRAGVAPSPMDFAPDSGMPLDVSVAH